MATTFEMSTTTLTGKHSNGTTAQANMAYTYNAVNARFGRKSRDTGDAGSSGSAVYRAVIVDFSANTTFQKVQALVNAGATVNKIEMAIEATIVSDYTFNLTIGSKSATGTSSAQISTAQKVNFGTIAKGSQSMFAKTYKYDITTCQLSTIGMYCIGAAASSNAGCYTATKVWLWVELNIPNTTLTTSVTPSGYGTVTAGGSIAYNGTKSITATPTTSSAYTYKFSKWTLTGAGSISSTTTNPTTFTASSTGSATLQATFTRTAKSYTLTTAVSPSGAGTVTAGGSIAYGSTKTLTATAASGYQFSAWTISGGGSLSTTTAATTTFTGGSSASTVTAVFISTEKIVSTARYISRDNGETYISSTAGGSISPTTKTFTASGQTQVFTITKNTGYNFADPVIDLIGDGSLSEVTISGNTATVTYTSGTNGAQLNVNFNAMITTLKTEVAPDSSYGTVTAQQYQGYYGQAITVTATPHAQTQDSHYIYTYSFDNWTKTSGGSISSTTTPSITFTFTTVGPTLTANFRVTKVPIGGYDNIIHIEQQIMKDTLSSTRNASSIYTTRTGTRTNRAEGRNQTSSSSALTAARTAAKNGLGVYSYGNSTRYTNGSQTRVGLTMNTESISYSSESTRWSEAEGCYIAVSTATQRRTQETYIQAYSVTLPSVTAAQISNATLNIKFSTQDLNSSQVYYVCCATSGATPTPLDTSWCAATVSFTSANASLALNITSIVKAMKNNSQTVFYIIPSGGGYTEYNHEPDYIITTATMTLDIVTTVALKTDIIEGRVYYNNGTTLKPAYILYNDGATLLPTL